MVAYCRIETLDEASQRVREENGPNQRKRLKPAPLSDGGKTPETRTRAGHMMTTKRTLKGLINADQILVSDEEMQRLYLDGKPIRRYCMQCRGPKLMIPLKDKNSSEPFTNEAPAKACIVCRTCGTKYWAKVENAAQ